MDESILKNIASSFLIYFILQILLSALLILSHSQAPILLLIFISASIINLLLYARKQLHYLQ